MDVKALQSLMEIQGLQSFGSVKAVAEQPTTSLFSQMMQEMLSSTPNIGMYSSQANQLLGVLSGIQGTPSTSLLYQGNTPVFVPSSVHSATPPLSTALVERTRSKSYPTAFQEIISQAAAKYQLPEKLISAVIKQESNFNPQSVSYAGASGLMQLMPGTAKHLGVTDVFDPQQNIMGGAKYLRQMLDRFDGKIELALAAYNAGPGSVKKYGGIPPYKETVNYVSKVLRYFQA